MNLYVDMMDDTRVLQPLQPLEGFTSEEQVPCRVLWLGYKGALNPGGRTQILKALFQDPRVGFRPYVRGEVPEPGRHDSRRDQRRTQGEERGRW